MAAAVPHEHLILVGHSWGGPIVRGAAARLREEGRPAAGVVLVDPADELADLYFTPVARLLIGAPGALMPLLARMGLLAPLQRSATRSVPEPWRAEAAAAVATLPAARALRAESRTVRAGLEGSAWTRRRRSASTSPSCRDASPKGSDAGCATSSRTPTAPAPRTREVGS